MANLQKNRDKHGSYTTSVNNVPNQIALLGTSADPPTFGHAALLEGLCKLFPKVITWASNNPFKSHSSSLYQRYELLSMLVNDLSIPNLEINQSLSSRWTITTLIQAEKLWPESKLIFIIGSDLITQVSTWNQISQVLQKAHLGIAPRNGWPINKIDLQKLKELGGKIDILPLEIPTTSSSSIRSMARKSDIPQAILPTLIQKNLYGMK